MSRNNKFQTINHINQIRTKKWVEINDDAGEAYTTNSQIKFEFFNVKSSSCDYSDSYILVNGTITVAELTTCGRNNGIEVLCAPFIDCVGKISNTQIDNTKDIDVVMLCILLQNIIIIIQKHQKNVWQYFRDEPALTDAGVLDNFLGSSALFKYNQLTIN